MKKIVSLMLALTIVFTMLPLDASAKTTGEKVGEKIGYELYSYYWQNGTLYVQGYIVNNNKKYDLLGMEDAILVVTDSKGLELFYVELNDTYEQNCILRPESKRTYNFKAKSLIYDSSAYSDMYSGLKVFFVSFTFGYDKCKGKNCENCQGIGLDLDENPFVDANPSFTGSKHSNNCSGNSSNTKKNKDCGICNGNKKCHVCKGKGSFYCEGTYCLRGQCTSCKGTGLYDHGSYVSKCLVCKGDGECNICNGTNLRDCTICHGSGKCNNCK